MALRTIVGAGLYKISFKKLGNLHEDSNTNSISSGSYRAEGSITISVWLQTDRKNVYYNHVSNTEKIRPLFPWTQILAVNYRMREKVLFWSTGPKQRIPTKNKKEKTHPPLVSIFMESFIGFFFFCPLPSRLVSWHPLISALISASGTAQAVGGWRDIGCLPLQRYQASCGAQTKKPRKPDPTIFLWIECAFFIKIKGVCVHLFVQRWAIHTGINIGDFVHVYCMWVS